ncbi:MAG: hypothetical protein PHR87_10525, partial [Sulfurospirillaceae bacterium]|nr:hypothetical protein [Sulfurospirillaceae bacterium]
VKIEQVEYKTPIVESVKEEPHEKAWIKELAQQESREFFFPVNELYMQIDMQGSNAEKNKSFRLVIDRADRYSLFCIVQTLASLHLPYVVIKEGKTPIIYVQEKSIKQLEHVVLELEKYDIKSKIIEVWL